MADAEQNLDLSINVDIGGVKEKIDAVTSKIKEFVSEVGDSASEAAEKIKPLNNNLEENQEAAEGASRSFEKMTGAGLALLFAGRFLDQTFGSLARSMFDMFGITDMFSGAMKTVLLPAFQLVSPIIIDLINKFMNMNDTFKMVVGFVVLIAAALAPVIALVGQFIAGATALSAVLGGAGLVGVLGTLATVIGVVVGALAILAAGFQIGMSFADFFIDSIKQAKQQFQNWVKVITSLMEGDLSGAFNQFMTIVENTADFFIEQLTEAFEWLLGFIPGLSKDLAKKARKMGKNFVDKVVNGIKSAPNKIKNALSGVVPEINVGGGDGGASGFVDSLTRANDFVLSDGKLVRTHPNDTIMATKDPSTLGQGGDSGGDTVIVKDPTVRDDRDVDKIADEVEKRLDRQTRGRSGIR